MNLSIISYARNGALGPIGEWKLKDCIAVHKLLGTVLADQDAASSKYNWVLLFLRLLFHFLFIFEFLQ